ncbi:MAG TPA: pantetheine-phosphate adenylyltransferase, partial [Dehalococcoidia bacterium]|nr:pantetheine-phosphate adenylyltransferase [Dehalococcoidia bacterium]
MVTALYPGSFDPVTVGHVDVVTRAANLFDKVVIAVYETPSKNLLFNTEERAGLMKEACKHLQNVEVQTFTGLVVRYAREIGAG